MRDIITASTLPNNGIRGVNNMNIIHEYPDPAALNHHRDGIWRGLDLDDNNAFVNHGESSSLLLSSSTTKDIMVDSVVTPKNLRLLTGETQEIKKKKDQEEDSQREKDRLENGPKEGEKPPEPPEGHPPEHPPHEHEHEHEHEPAGEGTKPKTNSSTTESNAKEEKKGKSSLIPRWFAFLAVVFCLWAIYHVFFSNSGGGGPAMPSLFSNLYRRSQYQSVDTVEINC